MIDNIDFSKLFVWDNEKVEDVRFWCEPALTNLALDQITEKFDIENIDGFGGLEAKGFCLAGIASSRFDLPTVFIRKYKPFFEVMAEAKVKFKNWKGEQESLTILSKTIPDVKSVLIVDDVIESGASLRASVDLLRKCNIDVAGAFYLLDSAEQDVIDSFDFPIKSILKKTLFT